MRSPGSCVKRFTDLLLAWCAVLLIALLVPAAGDAAGEARVPVSIRALPFISHGPIFIATEEGDFARQGIEARLIPFRDPAESLAALVAGQLDVYAGLVTAGFMEAVRQGARLRVVADQGHAGPGDRYTTFMVRQELIDSGRFRTLKDLRGLRLALTSRGDLAEMFMLQMLRNRALLTDKDVQLHQIPIAILPDALRSGTVDGALLAEPLVTRLETLRVARTVLTLHDVFPRAQIAVIIFGPNLLVRNPGLGQRFMNAYLRGIQQYNLGKSERNIAIMQKYTREEDALLRRMPWPLFHPDGHVNVEFIMQTQAWWVREGWLWQVVNPDQFLETGFARRAFQALTTSR